MRFRTSFYPVAFVLAGDIKTDAGSPCRHSLPTTSGGIMDWPYWTSADLGAQL